MPWVWKKGEKKKGLFSKLLIIGIFAYIIYFNERVLDIVEKTQVEPVVLIGFVSSLAIAELGFLFGIKKNKNDREE